MDIIFTAPTPPQKEIRDSNFRDFYPSINPALYWETILPYIKDAVRTFVFPHIGRAFYAAVCAHTTPDSGIKDEIKELLSSAIAKYAIYLAMPHINVTISDMGVQQNRNEKSGNAAQWAYNQSRWAVLYAAERALDDLLNYMYDNKSNSWLKTWTDSDSYTFIFTDFIAGRKEMSTLSGIKTMRGFWSVVPFIKKQENELKKIIGYRTYDDIKTKLTSGSAKEMELIKLIKYFLTESAIYEAMPSMNVMLEDGNLYSVSTSDVPNIGVNASANITAVNTLREQLKNKAKYYENEIRNYLTIYVDDFDLYKEDCYIADRPRSVFHSSDQIGGVML
jgi:hypothetical protein